jgi:hypothetical protein
MSVSLIKRPRQAPERAEEIPIATDSTFERYWLWGARELGLKLVPLLWDPFWPNEAERVQLAAELRTLRDWVAADPMHDRSHADEMARRISSLIHALESGTCDAFEFCFG